MICYNIFLILLFASTMRFVYKKQWIRGVIALILFLTFFILRLTVQPAVEIILEDILSMPPYLWVFVVVNIILLVVMSRFEDNTNIMNCCTVLYFMIRVMIISILNTTEDEVLGVIWLFAIISATGCAAVAHIPEIVLYDSSSTELGWLPRFLGGISIIFDIALILTMPLTLVYLCNS